MLRLSILLALSLLVGCASGRTSALVVDESLPERVSAPAAAGLPSKATAPAAPDTIVPAPAPEPVPPADPALTKFTIAPEDGLHGSRFTIKAGYYGPTEDEIDDGGFIVNLSWMRFLSKLFALEFEAGYVDVDGSDSGVDSDVWGVPLMVNGRLNVPIWVLDVYGGAGLGGFYYDAEAEGAVSDDDTGFLFGGNAFIGSTINLAEALALGLELKYYVTDEISDFDVGLDAYALMLTLGWSN